MRYFDVISLGEILVEIMRHKKDIMHNVPEIYLGPYPSGAPAITIDCCARLGLKCGFIGVVGADDFGLMLIERLRSDGVDVSRIRIDEKSVTGIAFVAYKSDGSRRFVFNLKQSASANLSPEDVDPEYISKAKVLHISGSTMYIGKGPREACLKAIEIARSGGLIISLDPNIRIELSSIEHIRETFNTIMKNIDIILVGEDELTALTGEKETKEAVNKIIGKGPKIVAVKMGKKGSVVFLENGETYKAKAFEVEEVDPTGAGDVFNAAFIYGYLKKWNPEKILLFANAVGAIKVTKQGPMEGPLSINEVMEFLGKHGINSI
ncbi:MAG: sugar kinase [Candidatus Methanomethylicia archaeon]